MNISRKLRAGALTSLSLLAGCGMDLPTDYVDGVVKREEIIGSSYILQIETDKGTYTASVVRNVYGNIKSIDAISLLVEEGTKVRFPLYNGKRLFGEDKVGMIFADNLIVLNK